MRKQVGLLSLLLGITVSYWGLESHGATEPAQVPERVSFSRTVSRTVAPIDSEIPAPLLMTSAPEGAAASSVIERSGPARRVTKQTLTQEVQPTKPAPPAPLEIKTTKPQTQSGVVCRGNVCYSTAAPRQTATTTTTAVTLRQVRAERRQSWLNRVWLRRAQ